MVSFILILDYFAKHISVLLNILDYYKKFRWVRWVIGGILVCLIVLGSLSQLTASSFGF
jgi:hypothetical protein